MVTNEESVCCHQTLPEVIPTGEEFVSPLLFGRHWKGLWRPLLVSEGLRKTEFSPQFSDWSVGPLLLQPSIASYECIAVLRRRDILSGECCRPTVPGLRSGSLKLLLKMDFITERLSSDRKYRFTRNDANDRPLETYWYSSKSLLYLSLSSNLISRFCWSVQKRSIWEAFPSTIGSEFESMRGLVSKNSLRLRRTTSCWSRTKNEQNIEDWFQSRTFPNRWPPLQLSRVQWLRAKTLRRHSS